VSTNKWLLLLLLLDKGQEIVILQKINKEDSSPSERCVRCPKVKTLVEMFHANLQRLLWNCHVGVPLWYTNMAAGK